MAKFDNWTDEKLAAQCIFPRLDIDRYNGDEKYADFAKNLAKIGVGGFCVFNGNTETAKNTLAELQMLAEVPLLFCADFENGVTMRLEDGTDFPHAMALGKTGEYTEKIAQAIARETKDLGILWNLAPVCDINSDPKNPVINIRSFGEDKAVVTENILHYIKATQDENVAACAKHFPGHGDTNVDSHTDFPILNKTLAEMEANEWQPFLQAIRTGNVKSVMVGHLIVSEIDDKYPASLSKIWIKNYLRDRIKYDGIVLTDALDMRSIVNKYSFDEIIELAFVAGNDILLMPHKPAEAIEILSIIIKNNSYKEQLIKSIDKIYNLKRWAKLIPLYAQNNTKSNIFAEHQKLALRAALQAIEVKDSKKSLPLPESGGFAGFSIIQKDEDLRSASRFFTMLAGANESDCDFGYIDENISDDEIEQMKDQINEAKFILFALFYRGRGYSKSLGSADKLNKIINKIADGRDYVVVICGDPYIAKSIVSETKIVTYSDSFPSLAAAVMKLTDRVLPDNY